MLSNPKRFLKDITRLAQSVNRFLAQLKSLDVYLGGSNVSILKAEKLYSQIFRPHSYAVLITFASPAVHCIFGCLSVSNPGNLASSKFAEIPACYKHYRNYTRYTASCV